MERSGPEESALSPGTMATKATKATKAAETMEATETVEATETTETLEDDGFETLPIDLTAGIDIKALLQLTVAAMSTASRPSTFGIELTEKEKAALTWMRKQVGYDPVKKGRQNWKAYTKSQEKYAGHGPEWSAYEPKRQEKVGFCPVVCDPTAPESTKLLTAKTVIFSQVVAARLKTHGRVGIGSLLVVAHAVGCTFQSQNKIADAMRQALPFYKMRFCADGWLELDPSETIPPFMGWKTYGQLFDSFVADTDKVKSEA